jgi:hypothetical protein
MLMNLITQYQLYSYLNELTEMIKIGLYKTLLRPVLCYGTVSWTVRQMTENIL